MVARVRSFEGVARPEVRFVPGLGDEIIREPHVHRLATELADCIDRCLTVHKAAAGPLQATISP